jgi:hypothetical protein
MGDRLLDLSLQVAVASPARPKHGSRQDRCAEPERATLVTAGIGGHKYATQPRSNANGQVVRELGLRMAKPSFHAESSRSVSGKFRQIWLNFEGFRHGDRSDRHPALEQEVLCQ